MTRMIRYLMAVALTTLTLAGCATVGEDFPKQKVAQIHIGETNREAIESMFGEPWRTGLEDGKRTWTYGRYRWSLFSEAQTTDLVVRFDDNGTVSSYVFNTTESLESE